MADAGVDTKRIMSTDRPKRDTMSLEEATVSNMWEIIAIVEVLERKGCRIVRHQPRMNAHTRSRDSGLTRSRLRICLERGYFFLPRMASLAALATRNLTTRLAGILIAAPVWGFRPMRALRFTKTSFPSPGITNMFFASL